MAHQCDVLSINFINSINIIFVSAKMKNLQPITHLLFKLQHLGIFLHVSFYAKYTSVNHLHRSKKLLRFFFTLYY